MAVNRERYGKTPIDNRNKASTVYTNERKQTPDANDRTGATGLVERRRCSSRALTAGTRILIRRTRTGSISVSSIDGRLLVAVVTNVRAAHTPDTHRSRLRSIRPKVVHANT